MAIDICEFCGEEHELDKNGICEQCNMEMGGGQEEGKESTPPAAPPKEKAKPAKNQKALNGDDATPVKTAKTEAELANEYQLLEILGFERYDDTAEGQGLKFKFRFPTSILPEEHPARIYPKIMLTRKYSDKFPGGHWSAVMLDAEKKIVELEGRPIFLQREDCQAISAVQQFYQYRASRQFPPKLVVGHLVSVKGNSRCIELMEGQGEEPGRKISYPETLIKRQKDGTYFIPASLNVADKEGKPRMAIPRDLIIENYKEDEKRLLAEKGEAAPPRAPPGPAPAAPKPKDILDTQAPGKEGTDDGGDIADDMLQDCIIEGTAIVENAFAKYRISDYEKADFAVRIGLARYIDEGKERRMRRR